MSEKPYLDQLRLIKGMVPGADTLGLIMTELLAVSANGKTSFNMTVGSANCVGLYKDEKPWGALVNFKAGNLPSFVHELTHASCFVSFEADLINYKPKKANTVPYTFTKNSIPNTPADTRACTNEVARRLGWHDGDAETFLTLNLNNLEAWVDVTDFSAPLPWLDKMKSKEIKNLEKLAAKGKATLQQANKLQSMQQDNATFGVLMAPKKDKEKNQLITAEKNRKRDYMKDRISYGRVGMSGMGDVHFEYDTVVNQMLCQMYLWGFRPSTPVVLTMPELSAHVTAGTVPAGYLYGRLELLARDAYDRRTAARNIAQGANPVVAAPTRVINPPKTT